MWDNPWTIHGKFAEVARTRPDAVALQMRQEEGYVEYRYHQIHRMAEALARSLVGHGIAKGDRIGLMAESRPEWGIAYLGIVGSGAIAVPLDTQLTDGEVANLLRHAEVKFVLSSGKQVPRLRPICAGLSPAPRLASLDAEGAREGVLAFADLAADRPRAAEGLPEVGPEDVASILYTSGTTGTPKGVMLSHRNLVSNGASIWEHGLCRPSDNILALLPLHHAYAFQANFLVPLYCGARVTYLASLKGPDILRCMQETGVTVLVGVPQLFAMLHRAILDEAKRQPFPIRSLFSAMLRASRAIGRATGWNAGRPLFGKIHRRFGGRLRLLVSGGARLDPAIAADFEGLGFPVREGYGLTETSPVATFNPMDRPKLGTVGKPIPGVEVRIVGPNARGEGEIAVRGENVMLGYYRDPEATRDAIRDGWLNTGDLGFLDAEGYLTITGRAKEVIVLSSGKNVYPEEVEAQYGRSPFIKEVCVLGVAEPGSHGATERLHALVLPDHAYFRSRGMANFYEMIRWDMENLSRDLPGYKRPTGLTILKEPLPRTRLGKIQRHLVAEGFLAGERPPSAEEGRPPSAEDATLLRDPVAQEVLTHLRAVGKKKGAIGLDDDLELDLGLDSLGRVELLVALEEGLGIALPDAVGSEIFTVRDATQAAIRYARAPAAEAGVPRTRSWKALLMADPPPEMRALLVEGNSRTSRAVSRLTHALSLALFRGGCRLEVRGLEHLPPRGPYIITPNHASYYDSFIVAGALPFRTVLDLFYVGFQAFFAHPIMARIGVALRVITIDLDANLFKALQAAAYVLRQGRALCIFPEGERSIDGEVKRFRKGVAILAKELEVPLIPACIEGSFRAWPRGQRWPGLHKLRIAFGPPVFAKELARESAQADEPYDAIAEGLRQRVLALRSSPSPR